MRAALLLTLALAAGAAAAQVDVSRRPMGSGTPGSAGVERAAPVANDLLHAPQYLPGFPTAATIWPRVVEVPCAREAGGGLRCDGYDWHPDLGRGEYLFIRPVVRAEPPPAPAERVVTEKVVPVIVERKVFIEVPAKRNFE
jgi:hypothetical protein